MVKKNRLASAFHDFATNNELISKFDENFRKAKVDIPLTNDKQISIEYSFDPSDDSYAYGTVIGEIDRSNRALASRIIQSKPVTGVTERIVEGKALALFGTRDGLKGLSHEEIKRAFEEDVRRFANLFDERLAGDSTTDAPSPDVKKKKKRKGK